MKNLKNLVQIVGIALVTAAIVQEMKKPPEQRRWHGEVAGFVPYDFRIPTMDMIKDVYWNPDEPRIFSERVLGVGWGINFGRLYKLIRENCCGMAGEQSA